jgi:hypothetical protein
MADEKKDSKKEFKEKEKKSEMTLQEAKAYRASLAPKDERKLDEHEKREQFRLFWAENKYKYGKAKDLEPILWAHLKSAKLDDPKDFEAGIVHFGLKKIR